MRLLVVTSEPGWVDALRDLFPAPENIIPCDVGQLAQNPALAAAADACFIAESRTSPWTVETLKQVAAVTDTPLFVLAEAERSQWEEAVLFAGAQHIFRRPLRAGVIQLAISRLQRHRSADVQPAAAAVPPIRGSAPAAEPGDSLALWRDFSRLLGRAADPCRLVGDYVDKLREVLRCGRVVLYVAEGMGAERTFRVASASGTDPREFEAFRLSPRNGVAQLVLERGTVICRQRLRADSGRDAAALRELMVFGAELAVPVAGEGIVGLLFVGPRVSGGEYLEHELPLLYHSVENLAPLLRRGPALPSPAERPAASDPARAAALLRALPIACALVDRSLRILDTNAAFRTLLGRSDAAPLGFDDLPAAWSNAIGAAVQNGAASARVDLDHRLIGAPRKVRLTVRGFATPEVAGRPGPAGTPEFVVTVEDAAPEVTAVQEADAAGVQNLLQRAGEQLSNEFRNALTPVDIMVQLARDASTSRVELERLSSQVDLAIHRLRRRVDDLAYLTKSAIIPEPTTVSAVLRVTRERLDDWLEARQLKRIVWVNEFSETALNADSRALALALAELAMNGIEASEGQPVTVSAEEVADLVSFRVRNAGVWSPPPESSGFLHRPFVSNKSSGVGLGVEVASRVAENHGGRLLLGPVSPEMVEATLRIPRGGSPAPKVETRVARAL